MNPDDYNSLLDATLKEVKKASCIHVFCRKNRTEPASDNQLVFVSVIGFESPEKYARHLQEIGDKLERKAMMFQSRLTTHYRPGFLKDIRWKLKDLHEKLIMEEAGENGNASSLPADGKSWYFRSAVVRVGPVQYTDPGIIASVKDSLNAYARVWHLAFQRVKSRLNVLEILVQYVSTGRPSMPDETSAKLVFNSSVPRFATLMRLFFEFELLGNNNKSELCELISRCFRTSFNRSISPKSFRNQFDLPAPECLEYWDEALDGLKQIIRDLWMTYHSN